MATLYEIHDDLTGDGIELEKLDDGRLAFHTQLDGERRVSLLIVDEDAARELARALLEALE